MYIVSIVSNAVMSGILFIIEEIPYMKVSHEWLAWGMELMWLVHSNLGMGQSE